MEIGPGNGVFTSRAKNSVQFTSPSPSGHQRVCQPLDVFSQTKSLSATIFNRGEIRWRFSFQAYLAPSSVAWPGS
jgi:hypothetical protein